MFDAVRARQHLARLGELFAVEPVGGAGQHLRISTPSRFPGGVPLELFLLVGEGEQKLSDLGNTLDFLGTLAGAADPSIPPPFLAELGRLYAGVEYRRGEFFVPLGEGDDLARAVDALRCAMLAAAYCCWRPWWPSCEEHP